GRAAARPARPRCTTPGAPSGGRPVPTSAAGHPEHRAAGTRAVRAPVAGTPVVVARVARTPRPGAAAALTRPPPLAARPPGAGRTAVGSAARRIRLDDPVGAGRTCDSPRQPLGCLPC